MVTIKNYLTYQVTFKIQRQNLFHKRICQNQNIKDLFKDS